MLGGPRIKHLSDVPPVEVVRIEYADGKSASVYEQFMETLPNFRSFYNVWEPGMIQRRHGHRGDHVVFVIKGEITVGDRLCTAGTHIFLMHGDTFGPWIAGPEGCETLGVVAGEGSSFCSDEDEAAILEFLAQRRAKRGAVPAIKKRLPWQPKGNPLPGPVYDPEKESKPD